MPRGLGFFVAASFRSLFKDESTVNWNRCAKLRNKLQLVVAPGNPRIDEKGTSLLCFGSARASSLTAT